MSHGLGKERVVASVSDVLCLRCQCSDQGAMFGREIYKFEICGRGQARNRSGTCQHRGHRQTTRVDEMTYDKSEHFPSSLQLRPG